MLRLTAEDGYLEYTNGFNAGPQAVTRYDGERWEEVSADLLCGVANVFQDVGIALIGKTMPELLNRITQTNRESEPYWEHTSAGWLPIGANNTHKSIYSFSETRGWLFVPSSREAVEQVVSWIFWAEDFRATAFTGYHEVRNRLLSADWNVDNGDLETFVTKACVEAALFQMTWGPGSWRLFPGTVKLESLVRLADPVVARINTELTD